MNRYRLMLFVLYFLPFFVYAQTQPKFILTPLNSSAVQIPAKEPSVVEYRVLNNTNVTRTLTLVAVAGVTQNTQADQCSAPFTLSPHASCILSLTIDPHQFSKQRDVIAPQVCKTMGPHNPQPSPFMCSQPAENNRLKISALDPNFPYGAAPQGNVCTTTDYYATPETMLGSWAMVDAVEMDVQNNVLPGFLTTNNVVYAVGTAAIGDQLGISNCSGGCNQLNGYCFALKFNDKPNFPFMIFQSVNIGANPNSFDIYLAGGGSGAFPIQCAQFWGTGSTVNWAANIENAPSCDAYFNSYTTIDSPYSVTYNNTTHTAKDTLMNACTYASAAQTGFNTQNWNNVTVVPVTCPLSLTQITGLALPSNITTVGNQQILNLGTLALTDFAQSTITGVTTTQMQDCKTPSSGYCGNVSTSVVNYEASISATQTAPILTGTASSTYCEQNPDVTGYCSWNDGQSSGSSYCNQSSAICLSCGNSPKWCVCHNGQLVGCTD